ncbi:GntR family transcriptional regulator [Streptomyces sp. J2-1]|uniref:GntR family transcriptional regulator n=1 Tax=Streptomyces corallincola TaxID=2851888 RepID=UPI001C3914B7|nr:GntR family transcriptional regulator [Streptomyces corallincola]MBV2353977.1 GntR family transcriptional regulator [Streptomyces corallincola]
MATSALRAAKRVRVKDDVLMVLRAAILNGEFAPGEHLNETELADRLQVSRGPVRDALAALAHEGLVTAEPHKGATVPLLLRRDVEEVYSLRLALETLAAEQAVAHARDEDIAALAATLPAIAEALADGDRRAVTEADLRFHDTFYRAARHGRLETAWKNIRSQVSLCLFSRNTVAATSREVVLDEHSGLVELLTARDTAALVDAVRAHLAGAYERLAQQYPD